SPWCSVLCCLNPPAACGFTVRPGDGEALAGRILALAGDRDLCAALGARARMAFERQWHKEKAMAEWEALFQAIGHPGIGLRPSIWRRARSSGSPPPTPSI